MKQFCVGLEDEAILVHSPVPVDDQRIYARIHIPIYIIDIENLCIIWANASGLKLFGKTYADVIDADGQFRLAFPAPFSDSAFHDTVTDYLLRLYAHGSASECVTFSPKGTPITTKGSFTAQHLKSGRPALMAQILSGVEGDVPHTRSAQVLQHTSAMLAMYDHNGQLIFENPASRLNRPEHCHDLSSRMCNSRDYEALIEAVLTTGQISLVALMYSNQGERWFDIHARRGVDQYSEGYTVMISAVDVTKRLKAEHEVLYLAHHDTLTGLANRTFLEIEAERYLDETRLTGNPGALIFIDLDRFKSINDTLGHLVGDDLLVIVAKRLKDVVENYGFVARLGGDEFVILISSNADRDILEDICLELRMVLSEPCKVRGHMLQVTPSIGVCIYPEHGLDIDTLMRKADLAMYKAKDLGRDRICFFDASMSREAEERVSLENSLRTALRSNELLVHYQPRLDAISGHILGAEGLLRWQHPTRGLVSAANFIEVAEEAGMIEEIGQFVTRQAMLQQKQWSTMGHHIAISINLSPAQLMRGGLAQRLKFQLEETGASPHYIRLEITESALLSDANETLKELHALRDLGFHLEIDDFGTGYSNLGYLQRYPVTALKIDRSFIADAKRWPIVQMIVQMGHLLGLTLVAEGIETQEQLRLIQTLGCHEYQGYLYSPAVAPDTFLCLLKGQNPAATELFEATRDLA